MTQSFIHIASANFIRHETLEMPADWSALFGNDQSLALEIGCGIGDFIVEMAAERPDRNFIAIDYYNKGCDKTCRRIDRLGLTNVRVFRVEARQFIVERIAKGSLAAVYINCPDPWPKKRHRKRRLVDRRFLEFLHDYLAPNGELFFATDFDDYGIEVANLLPYVAGYSNVLAPDLYRHELAGYPLSKYMRRFIAEGKKIYFMNYRHSSIQPLDQRR